MRNHASPAPALVSSTATNMEKRWPTGLDTLLKFTHSYSVADLLKGWHSIAAGPRKSEIAIIQSAAIDEYARSPAAATAFTLVVTKDLVESIVNFRFWSSDIDCLDESIHPFRTVYTSTAKSSQDQSHLQTYDSLSTDGSLRSVDIHLFRHVLKSNWPTESVSSSSATCSTCFGNLVTLSTLPMIPSSKFGTPLPSTYLNSSRFLHPWLRSLSVQCSSDLASTSNSLTQ